MTPISAVITKQEFSNSIYNNSLVYSIVVALFTDLFTDLCYDVASTLPSTVPWTQYKLQLWLCHTDSHDFLFTVQVGYNVANDLFH